MTIKPQTMTIAEVAAAWYMNPGAVQALIDRGRLKARQDGLISERAYRAYIRRAQHETQRYLALRRQGWSAKEAHQQVWGNP